MRSNWLDGLYVSIVPAAPAGVKLPHAVDEPGNAIHAGVWTGRYLAGVGYQYAVTHDPWVRQHDGQILQALTVLEEVAGKLEKSVDGGRSAALCMDGWRIAVKALLKRLKALIHRIAMDHPKP